MIGEKRQTSSGDSPMDAKPVANRRRWLRFSLRTLLLFITVIGIWLGIEVKHAMRIKQAARQLQSLNAQVFYDYEWDLSVSTGIPMRLTNAEPPGPKWLRRLIGDEPFIDIVGATVTEATDDLEFLKQLPDLQCLSIEKSKITDAALPRLATQTRLQYLWLEDTAVTDAGLQHLRDLKALRYLYLRNTRVTKQGVKELKQFLPNTAICYGLWSGSQIE